jgi:SAM-dependent methyltransferase
MSSTFDRSAPTYGEDVQASIDFAGAEHDYYLRRKADVLVDLARRRVGDPATLSVLDVGAGVGAMDAHLIDRFSRVIACDPSIMSITQAARDIAAADVIAADGGRLPVRDGMADIVVAVNVLHHVEPDSRDDVVAEMARVVRPQGLVVVFEHNPLNPLTRRSVANCAFDDGVELLGRREIRRRLASAALTKVEARYVIFTPFDVGWQHRVERRIGRLPLGAQHFIASRKP